MTNLPAGASLAAQTVRDNAALPFAPTHTQKKALETAQELEGFFMTQMLEHMFKEVKTDGFFGGGFGEGVFRSVMLQEYGQLIAKAGGIGLSEMVTGELMRMQEVK